MPAKKKAAPKKTTTNVGRWEGRDASDRAIAQFEATFAKEMGVDLSEHRSADIKPYVVSPTGSIALDRALRIGGWPQGRVCEVWGPEHAGKTTLMMLAVREAQRKYPNKMCGWGDMEQTFDDQWATTLGVDLNRLWRPPVRTAEQLADTARRFIESGLCSMVVLDSVGAMISSQEFVKESDQTTVGIVAKIVTRAVKQASSIGASNGTTTMVVNQVRANIDGNKFSPSETEAGGWALKHITTMKLWVRRGETLTVKHEGKDLPVGHEVAIRVTKNKCAPYGNTCSFYIKNQPTETYGEPGVDIVQEAFEFGTKVGVIKQHGGWYNPNPDDPDFKINGGEKVVAWLRDQPALVEHIRERVLADVAGGIHEEKDATDLLDLSAVEV